MTTRLTAVCLVLLVAACGDDGGNNSNDTCGDGQRTGAEQCDDGNTTGGDGCSATCRNESSGPVCGDAVISGTEECDDGGTVSGDGCSASCEIEGGDCGNGELDASEDCDDGNTANNDGCTGCNVDNGWTCNDAEPSVCTQTATADGSCTAPFPVTLTNNNGTLEGMATGNTTGGSSHVAVGACDGEDSGAGNDLVYSFTTTEVRDVVVRLEDTTFDAIVRVSTSPCMLATEVIEYVGGDGCSDQFTMTGEFLAYPALAAGTYYVHVDGYDAAAAGPYTLHIAALPTTCGDGVLDELEFCDDDNTTDGDGCNSHCSVEAGYDCDTATDPSVCVLLCGDGVIDEGEECDDDGNANGDGCTATCTLEYDVLETEPNDTTPQTITAANHIIKGSLAVDDDVDLYTFTLTAPAKVEIETYFTIDAANTYGGSGANAAYDCDDGTDTLLDTVVDIYPQGADVMDPTLALTGDDDDGDDGCSYVGTRDSANDFDGDVADAAQGTLPAGTYVIKVTGFNGLLWERYMMNVRIATAPAANSLAINEYMGNDGTADTNCDTLGTTSANTDDEFVEIVNKSAVTVDLTNLTINDATGVRHTFTPTNTGTGSRFLDPGKAIVVWGGGEPACPGVTNWFLASSNSLALNNGGDTISVRSGATVLATVTFAATTMNVSNNLDVDITGATYMLHNAVTGHVGDFSPGKKVNATPF